MCRVLYHFSRKSQITAYQECISASIENTLARNYCHCSTNDISVRCRCSCKILIQRGRMLANPVLNRVQKYLLIVIFPNLSIQEQVTSRLTFHFSDTCGVYYYHQCARSAAKRSKGDSPSNFVL